MKKTLTASFLVVITLLVLVPQTFAEEKSIPQDLIEERQQKQAEIEAYKKAKQERIDETHKINLEKQKQARSEYLEKQKQDRLEHLGEQKQDRSEYLAKQKQDRSEYLAKLKEEKKKRLEEIFKSKKQKLEDSKKQLELESRGVKAHLKNAQFSFDSKTEEVTLTSADGQEHTLNHLPDQAIERMRAKIDDNLDTDNVKIETLDDGTVEYTTLGTKKTKLFGLISRNIDTQVTLNDENGDVTEEILPAKTFLSKLLDRLSF